MSHPEERCVFFGHEDPIMFCNEAFSILLGTFHPAAIVLSATLQPPSIDTGDLCFIPLRAPRADVLSSPEWGKGEVLYLQFDVRDTGKGLMAEEMGRLFGRFPQAYAKTAAEHGGSDLGLFISHELAELHGGKSEYPQPLERAAHSPSTSKLGCINPKSRTTERSLIFPLTTQERSFISRFKRQSTTTPLCLTQEIPAPIIISQLFTVTCTSSS
jgi:hypothetical protein